MYNITEWNDCELNGKTYFMLCLLLFRVVWYNDNNNESKKRGSLDL